LLARDSTDLTTTEIASRLSGIVHVFMSDFEFRWALEHSIYGNQALKHIFIEYDNYLLRQQGQPEYDLAALRDNQRTSPQIEHFFAVTPAFDFPSRGFTSNDDYMSRVNTLGNLTLLERKLNNACLNRTPEEKVNEDTLYKRSRFRITKRLLAQVQVRDSSVTAEHIGPRTTELADFCMKRWPLWK
jgi:hypothetical protein